MSDVTCPVCEVVTSSPPVEHVDAYRMYHCGSCDLVWAEPLQTPGAQWYAGNVEYHRILLLGLDALQWNHRQFLRDLPLSGGRLLDVGCGSGQFLAAAARHGYRVSGLDFNPVAMETARRRYGLPDLFCGTLEDFCGSRPEAQFEVITAFEVLEHLDNPKGFLRRTHGLLVPGGYLALSVPFRDRWPRIRSLDLWDAPPHHFTRWSRKAIVGALSEAGFRVVRVATGWHVGEELIQAHVRLGFGLGTMDRLLKRGSRPGIGIVEQERIAGTASRLASLQRLAARLLGAPVNLVLKALGATGLNMYALAQKP